jgi:DNA integrity scanning protein DisA with diadenylate cyclase activity
MDLPAELGLRHRSAIGISEKTDAMVLVVSEETGTISLIADGNYERNLFINEIREQLQKRLNTPKVVQKYNTSTEDEEE